MTRLSQHTTVYITHHHTPLGEIILGANDEGLCLLEFTENAKLPQKLQHLKKTHPTLLQEPLHPINTLAQQQLDEYFDGDRNSFTIPLYFIGTEFQQTAWKALLNIPFGGTVCYEEQAQMLNKASAVRAVASANGANLIAIIVPCHRVIGKNGSLTGYAGGTDRKAWLLAHEQANTIN